MDILILISGIVLILVGRSIKEADGKISTTGKIAVRIGIVLAIVGFTMFCLGIFLATTYLKKPGLPFQEPAKPISLQKITDEYFIHKSGTFRIKPPQGYGLAAQTKSSVDFSAFDFDTRSNLTIEYKDAPQGYNDEQLLKRFQDEAYKQGWISAYNKSSSAKIFIDKSRYVNNIPAWEFTIKGYFDQGPLKGKIIVFYKNKKAFDVIFFVLEKYYFDQEKSIEEALKTLEVMK